MMIQKTIGLMLLVFLGGICSDLVVAREATNGPLVVHPKNPRYFADASGKVVYLTGSHSWDSLRDWRPVEFDFERYLDFLNEKNHNFVRLWVWDLPTFDAVPQWELKAEEVAPFPWLRKGPGLASDGRQKFDLTQFNPEYFDRLEERVEAAGKRGIYISIMLFEGWNAYRLKDVKSRNMHPFVGSNNVNGINLSGNDIYSLGDEKALRIQEAYVSKVIETVGHLDNVLYEIVNEAHPDSKEWQYHLIDFIHECERGKPQQHPVGMTHFGGKNPNEPFFASAAEWISPGFGTYYSNPPAADGRKVIITDSDHVYPLNADHPWVWKSFCRGMNVILMDSFTIESYGSFDQSANPRTERSRSAMGHTKSLADRMDLAAALPLNKLSSTEYCLADEGREYLIYQPKKGKFTVDLKAGSYRAEWIHPVSGKTIRTEEVFSKGGPLSFEPGAAKDSVLYLKK